MLAKESGLFLMTWITHVAKKEPNLELATSMVYQVMLEFSQRKKATILCDSRNIKQNLAAIVDKYPNLDL